MPLLRAHHPVPLRRRLPPVVVIARTRNCCRPARPHREFRNWAGTTPHHGNLLLIGSVGAHRSASAVLIGDWVDAIPLVVPAAAGAHARSVVLLRLSTCFSTGTYSLLVRFRSSCCCCFPWFLLPSVPMTACRRFQYRSLAFWRLIQCWF